MIHTGQNTRSNRTKWIALIIVALAVHLIILLSVRQSFFDLFRKSIDEPSGATRSGGGFPDAIIAIPVVVDGEEPRSDTPQDRPNTPRDETPARVPGEPGQTVNLRDIVGDAVAPIPSEGSGRTTAVPPRPLEITWPETRKLGHCLDTHIDIRIHVDDQGEIIELEPVGGDDPPDCVAAAMEAARRIRFAPGRIKGRPAAMWTQIRIDFRDR